MPKKITLSPGEAYGDWTVIEEATEGLRRAYKCICKCGKIKVIPPSHLYLGKSKQCINCANNFKRLKFSIGSIVNNWTIISEEGVKKGNSYYKCQCICGAICSVLATKLKNKASNRCNNCASQRLPIGLTINNWTILSKDGIKKRATYYNCKCICGKIYSIIGSHLKAGMSNYCRSCSLSTHGLSKTEEYSVWQGLFKRCENPKSQYFYCYGGRGIKVCERWRDFENFFKDMGLKPGKKYQIDRTDNDGDYEPGNCKWVTPKENVANRRCSKKNKQKQDPKKNPVEK
jgi:hypothetical protein